MAAYDPARRLREHVDRLIGRECSSSDLLEIMRLTRLLVEHQKSRPSYPHVALYCDWVQHGSIDRHETAWKIIELMHEAVAQHDNGLSIVAVSEALSLAQLRQEMLVLFLSNSVRTEILDSYQNWRSFVGILLQDLCHRPLALPDVPRKKDEKSIRALIKRMAAKLPQGIWPVSLTILEQEERIRWRLVYQGLPGRLNLESELMLTEPHSNFRLP
jgi:hypothetical protein